MKSQLKMLSPPIQTLHGMFTIADLPWPRWHNHHRRVCRAFLWPKLWSVLEWVRWRCRSCGRKSLKQTNIQIKKRKCIVFNWHAQTHTSTRMTMSLGDDAPWMYLRKTSVKNVWFICKPRPQTFTDQSDWQHIFMAVDQRFYSFHLEIWVTKWMYMLNA